VHGWVRLGFFSHRARCGEFGLVADLAQHGHQVGARQPDLVGAP
jgi:hypothetical protein